VACEFFGFKSGSQQFRNFTRMLGPHSRWATV
jgi:hypothetical protein